MPSRRQLLQQALAIPLVLSAAEPVNKVEIICDQDLLSRESAAGYRMSLKNHSSRRLIVIAAASQIGQRHLLEIRSQVKQGAWLIWEIPAFYPDENTALAQRKQLQDVFRILPQPPRTVNQSQALYLRYRSPTNALVRTFSTITPISCPQSEAIAHYENEPVAIRKSFGRGGIVYLGSMLGPHLSAGDPQARALATGLFQLTSL